MTSRSVPEPARDYSELRDRDGRPYRENEGKKHPSRKRRNPMGPIPLGMSRQEANLQCYGKPLHGTSAQQLQLSVLLCFVYSAWPNPAADVQPRCLLVGIVPLSLWARGKYVSNAKTTVTSLWQRELDKNIKKIKKPRVGRKLRLTKARPDSEPGTLAEEKSINLHASEPSNERERGEIRHKT